MCGIAGFIGISKNKKVSFDLVSSIFHNLEERGKDASGYWGINKKNKIFFKKEPINSSSFINSPYWSIVKKQSMKLLIVHARKASDGMGDPLDNKNNHPFINESGSLSLIHNGKLHDDEYNFLRKKYKTESECDSELLFKLFEENENNLNSIQSIFNHIKKGSMAVAATSSNGFLWIFRNNKRPLYVFDMRETLGQIYFSSTPEIWEKSTYDLKKYHKYFRIQKFIELPENEIWQFSLEKKIILKKFMIRKS